MKIGTLSRNCLTDRCCEISGYDHGPDCLPGLISKGPFSGLYPPFTWPNGQWVEQFASWLLCHFVRM